MTRTCVAIIPARGGSVGVPRKNALRVGGIPLVARAVRTAIRTAGIDRVVVSTDDDEIATIAREWGADVIARPAEMAGDTATSETAVLHALGELERQGRAVDVVAFLQATSPFIPADELATAVARVGAGEADSVFSARESFEFAWRPRGDRAEPVLHELSTRPRRQDREPLLVETGAFYVFDAAGFCRAGHRFFGRTAAQVVPAELSLEIDTPADLDAARALAPLHRDTGDEVVDVDALVTDFDGVHTDDTASVSQDGVETVRVSRSDGMGVKLLREAGVPVLILSTERNGVVAARAQKLGVEVVHGSDDKRSALVEWAAARGIDLARVAYVGNDVNDLPALDAVGWPIAVPDADPRVIARCRTVLTRAGGHGAVREAAERVLAARRKTVHTEKGLPR